MVTIGHTITTEASIVSRLHYMAAVDLPDVEIRLAEITDEEIVLIPRELPPGTCDLIESVLIQAGVRPKLTAADVANPTRGPWWTSRAASPRSIGTTGDQSSS
jgi:hypothetical protein